MGVRILHSLWLIEVDPHRGGSISLRPYLVCCGFPFPGKLSQLAAFLIRKTHDVLLVHGTLRLKSHYCLRRNNNLVTYKNKADKVLGRSMAVRSPGGAVLGCAGRTQARAPAGGRQGGTGWAKDSREKWLCISYTQPMPVTQVNTPKGNQYGKKAA
jgi:hypothetical protein